MIASSKQIKKRVKQFGFTLIELMISVAIIGALISISVPLYTDFIVRARMTEVLQAMEVNKEEVTNFYATNNSFPTSLINGNIRTPYLNSIQCFAWNQCHMLEANLNVSKIGGDWSRTTYGGNYALGLMFQSILKDH